MMQQATLTQLLAWHELALPGAYRTLQFASLSFDVSFEEVFSVWTTGGTLVLPKRSIPNMISPH